MPESAASMVEAASDAATGPGKPATVRASRPATAALWCGIAALAVLALIALVITWVFAFAPRPMREAIWLERDHWLGFGLLGCIALLAAVAIGLQWSRVHVSAGPAGADLGGDR